MGQSDEADGKRCEELAELYRKRRFGVLQNDRSGRSPCSNHCGFDMDST